MFWGKSNALKRQSGTIGKANTQPERAASVRTGSGSKIEKVSYTEFERTGDVITETIVPAETIIEGNVITEGEVIFEGGYEDCSACGGDGCRLCGGGCLEGICHGLLQRSEFSFGVQGFKGPLDDGENANFRRESSLVAPCCRRTESVVRLVPRSHRATCTDMKSTASRARTRALSSF